VNGPVAKTGRAWPSTPCHTRPKHDTSPLATVPGRVRVEPCMCGAPGRPTGRPVWTSLVRGQTNWLLELTATSARRPQISPCAVAVAGRAPCMACSGQSPTQTGSQPAPASGETRCTRGVLGRPEALNERWRKRPSNSSMPESKFAPRFSSGRG
jgi:hypothetical protein